MKRFFLSASLGAALAFNGVTGALAAFDADTINTVANEATDINPGLANQIRSLAAACGGGGSAACLQALQTLVVTAQSVSLPTDVAAHIVSLARDAAAAGGVTSTNAYTAVSTDLESISPSSPTGTTNTTNTNNNTTNTSNNAGSPGGGGGGGGNFSEDRNASPGAS